MLVTDHTHAPSDRLSVRLGTARLRETSIDGKHLGMESVCEAGQSLIAGHFQVQVHTICGRSHEPAVAVCM